MKTPLHNPIASSDLPPDSLSLRDQFAVLALAQIIVIRPHETAERKALGAC